MLQCRAVQCSDASPHLVGTGLLRCRHPGFGLAVAVLTGRSPVGLPLLTLFLKLLLLPPLLQVHQSILDLGSAARDVGAPLPPRPQGQRPDPITSPSQISPPSPQPHA